MGTIICDPVTLTLEFDPFFENFNLPNNFFARALIFHMSFPCDKTFPWVPILVKTIFKNFNLLITFEQ